MNSPDPTGKQRHHVGPVPHGETRSRIEPDTDAYLHRIGYRGSRVPDMTTLRSLHRAHLYSVPFENLDIILGRRIALSVPLFYDKIVSRRRGGFCYELNGLYAWLLGELGFEVELLAGRMLQDGQPGEAFDHLALLVRSDGCWLADVGFGDLFEEPLRLDTEEEQRQGKLVYRVTQGRTGERVVWRRRPKSDWEAKYDFTLTPRRLDEFEARCHVLQTSPQSIFTQNAVCTLPTMTGRVTLAGNRLIVTDEGRRDERAISDEAELRRCLSARFGIDLDRDASIAALLTAERVDEVVNLVE